MTIHAFLEAAWGDHTDHPQDVADRLATSLHLVLAPEHVAPFVGLATHVFGEHLGQWQRGVELLEALRSMPAFASSAVAAGPIARGLATLRYASGDTAALDALSPEDRVCALATASAAFAGRNEVARAIAAYTKALQSAEAGLPQGSPAIRALAVGGNNLAATLEEKSDRSATESQAMLMAAQAALTHWKQAGTWLEEERALYRLARSQLQAGEPLAATASAQRCVEVCTQNDAPPFELFFAHAVLAVAQRAACNTESFESHRLAAMGYFESISDEDRKWCESESKELAG